MAAAWHFAHQGRAYSTVVAAENSASVDVIFSCISDLVRAIFLSVIILAYHTCIL